MATHSGHNAEEVIMKGRTYNSKRRRNTVLKMVVAAMFGMSWFMVPPDAKAEAVICSETRPHDPDPDCGQHNMMLIGQESVFLSHLPMFQSEHRFQVILGATFRKNGENLDGIYLKDRQTNPKTKMYTLVPERPFFILSTLFNADDQGSLRKSFPAMVFRGHFEREDTAPEEILPGGADVNVTRVVYARELRPSDLKLDELEYILFGNTKEWFLAHRITQAPDFDQIVSVKIDGHEFTETELTDGVTVTIPERVNSPAQRLQANETVPGKARVTDLHRLLPLQIQVTTEYYFEEGELLSEATLKQTPLEKEAGF